MSEETFQSALKKNIDSVIALEKMGIIFADEVPARVKQIIHEAPPKVRELIIAELKTYDDPVVKAVAEEYEYREAREGAA